MALTADAVVTYRNHAPQVSEFGVVAADIIYKGAAVGINAAGDAKPVAAADAFCGFAIGQSDNSAGAAGDQRVRVYRQGLIELDVATADATSVGSTVNATDDETFTLAVGSAIGVVDSHISGTLCVVSFKGQQVA